MAKKVVATFRKAGSKGLVKLIIPTKSQKTQSYSFKEQIVTLEQAKEILGTVNK